MTIGLVGQFGDQPLAVLCKRIASLSREHRCAGEVPSLAWVVVEVEELLDT